MIGRGKKNRIIITFIIVFNVIIIKSNYNWVGVFCDNYRGSSVVYVVLLEETKFSPVYTNLNMKLMSKVVPPPRTTTEIPVSATEATTKHPRKEAGI